MKTLKLRSLLFSVSIATVLPSIAVAQICTQPITLRSGVCPSGATTCTSKGSSLSFSEGDANTINIDNVCNALSSGTVVTNVATGVGLTGGPITSTGTISLDYSNTLTSNSLATGQCVFTLNGILCEGTTANAFETLLQFPDPGSSDFTIALPAHSGTVVATGDTATVTNTMLASSYSGVGACGTNLWASTLNANAAPTCTQINYTNLAGSVPSTISSSSGSSIATTTPATAITLTEDEAATTGATITRLKGRGGLATNIGDVAGQDIYQFRDSANAAVNGAIVDVISTNVTAGAAAADYRIRNRVGGALVASLTLFGNGTASLPQPTTIYQPTIGVAGTAKSSHIITAGTAPTVSCTGTGTGGTSAIVGTDAAFVITMSTGTAPSSAGTCTVTYNSAYVTNFPVCVIGLVSGAASWGSTASVSITTESLTAPQITWDNSVAGVLGGLTASSSYKLSGICFQK